jgi:hypothetical protein
MAGSVWSRSVGTLGGALLLLLVAGQDTQGQDPAPQGPQPTTPNEIVERPEPATAAGTTDSTTIVPTSPAIVELPEPAVDEKPAPVRSIRVGFDRTPTVTLIRPENQALDEIRTTPREKVYPCAWSFPGPARFPVPAFFPRYAGQMPQDDTIERDAAVIHEDMSFLYNPAGDYEVRFLITAPAMPVTLNLQLEVGVGTLVLGAAMAPPTVSPLLGPDVPVSLTIPPVVLRPPSDGDELHYSYLVTFRGTSLQLAERLGTLGAPRIVRQIPTQKPPAPDQPEEVRRVLLVGRTGVARFGSIVEPLFK